jgi:predicted membrane chloride channel (bestrophin family)
MEIIKGINAVISFLLEIAMLVSISYFGFYGDKHIIFKLLIGVLLPIGIVVFWSFFMEPTAGYRFNPAIVRAVALTLFLAAATMPYKANLPIWGSLVCYYRRGQRGFNVHLESVASISSV